MRINKTTIILGVILILAFAVRVYNFDNWLVFKADQSRDAFVIKKAVDDGIEYLPLLGPKIEKVHIDTDNKGVAHSLRLGPLYYYQQYIVAKTVGSLEPWVFALSDLFFSTLAIVLFYILAKMYFSSRLSLSITVLFAFSFYIIQYSRFAWNPNQLLFWELIFILGLYKSVFEKNKKKAGRWLSGTIIVYGAMSQFHTMALFGFLPVGIIFWLIYRPSIKLKYWLIGIGVVGLMYIPVVVSDINNKGDNLRRFITVLTRERDEYSLHKKISKVSGRCGEISTVMLTSFHDREIKKIEKYSVWFFMTSSLLLILSIFRDRIINLLRLGRRVFKKHYKQNPRIRKFGLRSIDFIKEILKKIILKKSPKINLLIIWLCVYLLIFSKLVSDLNRARYFLTIAPLVFIFLGFWFLAVQKIFSRYVALIVTYGIVISFLAMNFSALVYWHNSLTNFNKDIKSGRMPKMAYHRGFITINTMKMGLGYMVEKGKVDNKNICYANADYQYNTGMEYLSQLYYPNEKISKFGAGHLYNDCDFFVIARLKNGKDEIPEDISEKFKVIGKKNVGAWNIWQMEYKNEFKEVVSKKGVSSWSERVKDVDYRKAVYWKDLFHNDKL